MGQEWPSPPQQQPAPRPLPTIEDLPVAWEGYDRAQVEASFDAFYRHIAQLDATLRTLESVEVFREEAGSLRADLRAIRAAGWSPYPRGYTLAPERSLFGALPEAVPRILLEVVFLVAVAAVAAVAKLTAPQIVVAMAGAVLLTALVELIAARERRGARSLPTPEVVEPVVAAAAPVVVERPASVAAVAAEDGAGWAAFAEPSGQNEARQMGALTDGDEPAAELEEPSVDDTPVDETPVAETPVAENPVDETPVDETTEETEPPEEPEAVAETTEESLEGSIEEPEQPAVEQTEETPAVAEAAPVVAEEAADGPEPEPEPERTLEPERAERRPLFRRLRRDRATEPQAQREPEPVRAMPSAEREPADDTLPPWERGFDQTDELRPSRD